jgi:hypothetical protein
MSSTEIGMPLDHQTGITSMVTETGFPAQTTMESQEMEINSDFPTLINLLVIKIMPLILMVILSKEMVIPL